MHGPDFAGVDSRDKAEEMFRCGQLEKLLLLPIAFGGQDVPENVVYIPSDIAGLKRGIDDNVIAPLVAEGKFTRYQAFPEYHGDSFIPVAIHIEASEPGAFSTRIAVWGDALGVGPDAG
jgi:hypothetical protein